MKLATLLIMSALISLTSYSQTEPSKEMPPVKMLPKAGQVKQIYELPTESEYKVYSITGELIAEGNAKFIDYTNYANGTYVVKAGTLTENFEKK